MRLLHGCSHEEPVKPLPRQMRQVPVPEGWSDIFSGHFEPFLRLSNRKISQRRPFRHGSFHLIFPRLGHGLGQNRKSAAQKLRRCKQRIAPDFCRFPGGLRVPVRAVLQDPFLRRIVDIDQADALGIAAVPLKIVGRRPVEKLWTSARSHPL